MTMRASLIITAKDRASASFQRIGASARRMGDAFRPVRASADDASRAIARVGQNGWSRFARIGAAARKMAGDMRIAERAAYGMGFAIGATARKGAGLALSTAKWGAIGAAGAAGVGIGSFIGGIFSTASKFEQFQAQLEGTEGSAANAKAAMAWVAKFAAQTPYQLDEVTDAFVRARGVGIDPFNGAMREMGDAAAANRKTLMDSVEAIADAQTGEFERLKAFNITTSVKGNLVAFSYLDKAGKNTVKTTKKSAADIQKAILAIWDERHGGAMIRQSKTMAGLVSNLSDAWSGFLLKVADKGVFQTVKNDLATLLDWVNRLADDGTLDVWAKQISDNLKAMWDWGAKFVRDVDWKAVSRDLVSVAKAVWATALGLRDLVQNAQWLASGLGGSGGVFAMDGPLGGIGWNKGFYYEAPKWWSDRSKPAGQTPKTAPPKASPSQPKAIPPWKPGTGPLKAGAKPLDGNVKVDVNVKASGGAQVQSTRVSSNDRRVQPSVRTGRAMAEAA